MILIYTGITKDGRRHFKSIRPLEWVRVGNCIRCTSHKESAQGYPAIRRDWKLITIARRILIKRHGQVPKTHDARHTCDNRWCIRPDHIIIGTRQDNVNDMMARRGHWRHQ